jgi:Cd(II)/Pb(II)-responsive transcriptional regulator
MAAIGNPAPAKRSSMKIGDVARTTGTPAQTIRYYEREGLLPAPPRTEANYRRYEVAHVRRLALIRRCRALDMELAEIRALLALHDAPPPACDAVNALIDAHIGHVAERIAELQALRKELLALRARCGQPGATKDCGILQGLGEKPARKASSRKGL